MYVLLLVHVIFFNINIAASGHDKSNVSFYILLTKAKVGKLMKIINSRKLS